MILLFTLVLASLLSLLLLFYAQGGRSGAVNGLGDLAGRIRPVDLDAFRNLTDPREEEYLRANLSPAQFREVQRQRLRASVEYIGNTAHNAAVLLRLGEAAARSTDLRIAMAGKRLVDDAVRLRLYALLSIAKLYANMALPKARLSPGTLADHYQHLRQLVGQLALMQHPTQAGRFSAIL
jgi:hypothetical protein